MVVDIHTTKQATTFTFITYTTIYSDLKMWGAYSMLSSEHETIFQSEANSQMLIHALAIMQRIQSYDLFVLERFREWTERGGYKRYIETLGLIGLPNI